MDIISETSAPAGICLPEQPTKREVLAAQELRWYVEQMTGAALPIDQKRGTILIGGPERNSRTKKYISPAQFKKLVPGPEGIFIKTDGDILILAGSDGGVDEMERGTLYAVYELLERFFGVSLAAYSGPQVDAGEWIPKWKTLHLDEVEYIKPKADLPYRTAIVQYANTTRSADHALNPAFISWLGKNRYNRILTMGSIYEQYRENGMLEEAQKRGILFTVGHHESTSMFLNPEVYYDAHPEYYRMLEDGSRLRPQGLGGQLVYCCRSAAVEQVAQNILTWLERSPGVDTIAFWPNDGIHEQCHCTECAKHTKEENYVYFMNELAERICKKRPKIKLDLLVYFDLWQFPGGWLHPAIVADEATWRTDGLRRVGKPDGSTLANTPYEENLLKWREAGAEAVYYEYYMGVFPARQRLMPMADEMQAMCRRFMEVGIAGAGTQIEPFNLWNNIFNLYTYGRSAYDTQVDMQGHLERFCRIFGGGAKWMKAFFTLCEKVVDGQETIAGAGKFLIEHGDLAKLYDLLTTARSLCGSKRAANNIRLIRMALRYSQLECREDDSRDFIDYPNIKAVRDPSGELEYMSRRFDSYTRNDPGFAIDIPVKGEGEKEFRPDVWYEFE